MNIFKSKNRINDAEKESLLNNTEEQKIIGDGDIYEEPRRKNQFSGKKLVVIIVLAFVIGFLVFIFKDVFFKPMPIIRHASFPPKQMNFKKSNLNLSMSSSVIPQKVKVNHIKKNVSVANIGNVGNVKHSTNNISGNSKVKNTSLVNKKAAAVHRNHNFSVVPAIPLNIKEHIKHMLRYNSEVNVLKEQVKIAQLESEIKNLSHSGNLPGSANSGASSIKLIAIGKNTALVGFGKTNITMKVGTTYYGYKCLMIANNSVTLERNNKVINLSLGM